MLFRSVSKLIPDKTVGNGMRKTPAYESRLTIEEFEKARELFWDTRIQGNKITWQVLRSACEADDGNI